MRTLVALVVVMLLAAPAAADRDYLVHKVKEGDTLGLLAAEHVAAMQLEVIALRNYKHVAPNGA